MVTLSIAATVLAATLAFAQQEQKTVETKPNNGRIDYIERRLQSGRVREHL